MSRWVGCSKFAGVGVRAAGRADQQEGVFLCLQEGESVDGRLVKRTGGC